jgi:hypothetical protein
MPFFYFCAPLSFSRLVHSHKKGWPRLGQFSSRLIHLLIFPFLFRWTTEYPRDAGWHWQKGENFIWDTVSFDELYHPNLQPKLSNSTTVKAYWNIKQHRKHFALLNFKNWNIICSRLCSVQLIDRRGDVQCVVVQLTENRHGVRSYPCIDVTVKSYATSFPTAILANSVCRTSGCGYSILRTKKMS